MLYQRCDKWDQWRDDEAEVELWLDFLGSFLNRFVP